MGLEIATNQPARLPYMALVSVDFGVLLPLPGGYPIRGVRLPLAGGSIELIGLIGFVE